MTQTLIGRDIATKKDITIQIVDRPAGMLIIGKTGSGKSWLIENMAIDDIKQGMGCCVIEPSGKLINNIIARIPPARYEDVILLWPEDEEAHFGINIYQCPDLASPRMVSFTLNNIMDTFEKLYDMSRSTPRMAQVMRNLALTMMYNPGYTLVDIPKFLSEKPFRQWLTSNAPPNVRLFWQNNYDRMNIRDQWELIESTQNKIDEFVNDPLLYLIFGQSKTSVNFREVMDTGKILLVNLNAELPQLTDLMGNFITGQLLIAALSRDPMKKNRIFPLYVDEFQRFLTKSMETLLVEARKYNIATCVAHQVREQLDDTKKATTLQARSLLVFGVTGMDAEELSKEFDATPPQTEKPPGTTPADILNHLTDHPDEEVKLFWTIFVKKLLETKTMQPRTPLREYFSILEEKPYPYFLIDNKKVYFDPEFGRQLLEPLQQLFYNSSINRGGNEEILRKTLLLSIDMIKGNDPLFDRDKYYNFFADSLRYALYHVYLKPIEVTTTEWQETLLTQQNYSDRRVQIANQLTHLKVGQAKVRIPDGEFVIETIDPATPKAQRDKWPEIRQQLLEQTRKQYCKTRAEIEEEIRKRQVPPSSPFQRIE